MVFLLIFSPLRVSATSGSFDGFTKDGTYDAGNGATYTAYTYSNDDSLPSSGFFYFYNNNGTVRYYTYGEVLTDIITRKIGIVMEPSRLATFLSDLSVALRGDPNYYNTMIPVVNSSGGIVGVALNGLTGGKLANDNGSSAPNENVEVPSWEVNRVYNYYKQWIEMPEHALLPDWVTIKGKDASYFNSRLDTSNSTYYNAWNGKLNLVGCGFSASSNNIAWDLSKNVVGHLSYDTFVVIPTDGYLTNQYDSNWKTFLDSYGLSLDNNSISWEEALTKKGSYNLPMRLYNKSDYTNKNFQCIRRTLDGLQDYSSYAATMYNFSSSSFVCMWVGEFTIYRSSNVVSSIENNVYSQSTYYTSNYKNFSTSNNNSYSTTSNSINNSTSTNSAVYNETNTDNSQYIHDEYTNIDNSYSYIDNSQIVTNTTNIVNTYITNNYPPVEDDDNNNSGGSGGSGDVSGGNGDNIDDDGFLDTLLAAILKLLRAIGKIIATILSGIVDILTDLLLAITNITTGFDGIIQFIGSIIGFMPSEVVTIITVGLGLSVLIALLKMFGK